MRLSELPDPLVLQLEDRNAPKLILWSRDPRGEMSLFVEPTKNKSVADSHYRADQRTKRVCVAMVQILLVSPDN